jgi:hypothetical protein
MEIVKSVNCKKKKKKLAHLRRVMGKTKTDNLANGRAERVHFPSCLSSR